MSIVLVLVEHDGGSPRKSSLELLTLARRLGEPAAVVYGEVNDPLVDILGRYGATTVYSAPAGSDAYPPVAKAAALVALAARTSPAAILVNSGAAGKEVAARVAVRLDAGIITDAVDVEATPDGPVATQSVFAGEWTVRDPGAPRGAGYHGTAEHRRPGAGAGHADGRDGRGRAARVGSDSPGGRAYREDHHRPPRRWPTPRSSSRVAVAWAPPRGSRWWSGWPTRSVPPSARPGRRPI